MAVPHLNELDIESLELLSFIGYEPARAALATESPPSIPPATRYVDVWHHLRKRFDQEGNVRAAFGIAHHIVRFCDYLVALTGLKPRRNIHVILSAVADWCLNRGDLTTARDAVEEGMNPRELKLKPQWRTFPAVVEVMLSHMITRSFPDTYILRGTVNDAHGCMILAMDTQRLFDSHPYVYDPPEHLRDLFRIQGPMPVEVSITNKTNEMIESVFVDVIRESIVNWKLGKDPVRSYFESQRMA